MTPAVTAVSGPLIGSSLARQEVSDRGLTGEPACLRAHAAFARLWRRCDARHGPATGPRVLHECAAVPLLALLGYRRQAHSETARPEHVVGAADAGPGARVAVLTGGCVAGNADLRQEPGGRWEIQGDPTEAAFLVAERLKAGRQARSEAA